MACTSSLSAFGLAWGLLALMILFTSQVEAVFGPVSGTNPLFILAVYAPGIAAILLVWWHYGTKGVARFFRRPFSPWYMLLPALAITLFIGPLGEEFGWRGVALPLLQRRFAPLWASLILGSIWGVAFAGVCSGRHSGERVVVRSHVVGVVALSVIVTPMFNASGGSILIPVLFHYQMSLPIWPDAQPWENYLFAGVAVIIVIIERKSMLRRGQRVTEILAPSTQGGAEAPPSVASPR